MLPRPRRLAGAVAVLLAGAALAPGSAAALEEPRLRAQLSTLQKKLGPRSAALVVDLGSGRTVYARRADTALSPASNQKLFTTAAALLRFGPDATLATRVLLPPGGEVDEQGVVDALHLVGGGDPALNDVALQALAGEIAAAGVTRIRGGLLADESLFDLRRGSYDTRYRPDRWLGGWLGALTWAHGRPDAKLGPAQEAAERLHLFLRRRGVKVGKRPVVQALPRADAPLALPLASVDSPPMARLAAITNQPSDNFYAEMLVKGLGARFGTGGTTPAGIRVLRSTLQRIGVRPTRMVDGSGLSRAGQATPRQLVRLLDEMEDADTDVRVAWHASLAVIGRSGTLAKRMRGTAAQDRCRGKTGTLRGVSALSGYCTLPDGRLIGFSFLENAVDATAAKRVEDRMLAKVATLEPGRAPVAGAARR